MQTFKYFPVNLTSMVATAPKSDRPANHMEWRTLERNTRVRPLKRDTGVKVLDTRTRRGLTQPDVDSRMQDAPSAHLTRKVARGYEPKCVGPSTVLEQHDVHVVSNDKAWAFRLDSDTPVMVAPVVNDDGQTIGDVVFKFVSKDWSRGDKEGRDAHVIIEQRIKATGQTIRWPSAKSLALKVTLASKPNVIPVQYKYTLTACNVLAKNTKNGLDVGVKPIHTWNVRRPDVYNRAGAIKAGFIPAPQSNPNTGRPQFVKFTGVDYDVDGVAIDYKRFIGRVPPMYAEEE